MKPSWLSAVAIGGFFVLLAVSVGVIAGPGKALDDSATSLIIQLIAVFFGAIFALVTGVWLYRRRAEEETQQRRSELVDLVRSELEETSESLKSRTPTDPNQNLHLIYIQPLAIEHAVRSALLPNALSKALLSLARDFYIYNVLVEKMGRLPYSYSRRTKKGRQSIEEYDNIREGARAQGIHVYERCDEVLRRDDLKVCSSSS